MRRIFGAKKEVAPPPTLDETTDRLDVRGNRADDKINQLDAQLTKFKEQIKRTRPGPAQNAIKRRALQVSVRVFISCRAASASQVDRSSARSCSV